MMLQLAGLFADQVSKSALLTFANAELARHSKPLASIYLLHVPCDIVVSFLYFNSFCCSQNEHSEYRLIGLCCNNVN